MADGADDGSRRRDQPSHVKVVDSYTRPTGGEAPPETRWRGRLRGSGDTKPAASAPGPRTHIDVPDGRPTIVISEPGIDEEIAALAAAEAAEAARRAEEEERARRAEEEAARRAEEEAARRAEEEERARRAGEETSAGADEPEEPAGAGTGRPVFEAAASATVVIDDLDGVDGVDDLDGGDGAGDQPAAAPGRRRRSPSPRVRRRRRVVAAAAGVAVVGGGGAAALTLLPGRAGPHVRTATAPTVSAPTTTARPRPPAASSTTTTAAGPVAPSSTASGGATWSGPVGAYTVTLNARGACWVEVTAGPGGAVLSEETLAAGDVRTLNRPGPLWIRLGAAAEMTVTLDGRPLAIPAGLGDNPYNITIQSPG